MEEWVLCIFVTIISFLTENASASEGRFFNEFLLGEPFDQAICDQTQLDAAALDSATSVDNVPRLHGKWVSEDCEVRPGPEFLLRSYSFTKNNTFRLLQHFYEDESCILPMFSVVARGGIELKEPSWVTPSGYKAEYFLNKVTIIPHTTEAAERLSKEAKHKCTDRTRKTWKPHREYTIYQADDSKGFPEVHRTRRKYSRYQRININKEIDCMSAIGLEFNELMLIRTQWRPADDNKRNKELLLGDIHSRKESRHDYQPTAFQVPLLKTDQAHDCVNCQSVSKSTERSPPHLISKPILPPLPLGQWVSQRCEVRPLGMFLTRRLSFDTRDSTWIGEYKFHADPFCTEPAFAISASGRYVLGHMHNKEKHIRKRKTGTTFDFHIEDASLTLYDPTLRDTFNGETNCGVGPWFVGVAKELTPTAGCSILGITLPTTEYELIKVELDMNGTPLLFMGLPDTENKKRSHADRPTSFQAPLAQCTSFPQQNLLNNHLEPIVYARSAPYTSASSSISLSFLLLLSAIFLLR